MARKYNYLFVVRRDNVLSIVRSNTRPADAVTGQMRSRIQAEKAIEQIKDGTYRSRALAVTK